MEKHYFRLLAVSLHCLIAFGNFCDLTTTEYKIIQQLHECSQENYYCSYYDKEERIWGYKCFNMNILQVYQNINRNRYDYTCVEIKNSSIPTLNQVGNSWDYVRELRIENTNTVKIIPGFFNHFSDLTELSIVKNKIKTISDGVFSSIYKLYTLNLTENVIETVTQHSFSGLLNLRVLDLSKNKITFLPEDVFDYQNYLLYVDISDNMLKSVGTIFNMRSIITINVSHNFLTEFDFNQFHNSNITKIDLSNNIIDHVADINLNNVTISLAYNNIGVLPKIGNIKFFNISYNKIQRVDEIMLSETLQSLDLTGNNISVLTNHLFANLTNLEYLYFGHNNLSILQIDSLHNLHNLKYLDLSFNQIRQIPFGFFNDLNKLTYLDLSHNNMILDFHALSTLKSLQTIKFKNNKVQNFDSDILLSRFQFLRSITLSDDSWNCIELASIVHKLQLKNINLTPGQNRNVSNILGISCNDNVDLKEDTIIIQRNNGASAGKIDDILSNTSFFKSLQTIAKHISDNNSLDFIQNENVTHFSKFMENFNIYAANMQEYNNRSMEYMREILNNTNFFKHYLNSSKSSQTPINSFNEISNNTNPTSVDTNMEALISDKPKETGNHGVIFTNIFLAMILCCLIFSTYRNFSKPKIMSVQEQVQLM